MRPCRDCCDLDECARDGCYWARFEASLTSEERAVMDEFEAATAPVEED